MKSTWLTELALNIASFVKDMVLFIFRKPLIEIVPTHQPDPPVVVPPRPEPVPAPVEAVQLSPRERLYLLAKASLGVDASPNDVAPDEYGCMETVDDIYFKARGFYINGSKNQPTISTATGRDIMRAGRYFRQVSIPQQGCIIISATGLGSNPNMPNGHVGIMGKFGIMSNNSITGKFDEYYTLKTWMARYKLVGGYPVEFFEPI